MSYNEKNKIARELWAIVDKDGNILFSRGGSSSKPKLMVYESEESAKRSLNSSWIKQIIDDREVQIKRIYLSNVDVEQFQTKE